MILRRAERTSLNPKLRIAIVDDDNFFGTLVKTRLERNQNIEVSIHNTGEEMIGELDSEPDIAIIDFSLPDMSGLDILKTIKRKYNEIYSIMLSGSNDLAARFELRSCYPNLYIDKNEKTLDFLIQGIREFCLELNRPVRVT